MRHGTRYCYEHGCRRPECRRAALAYRRGQRALAKAEGRESYFRELAGARERKERYRGRCRECGAATSGCNGAAAAPELCRPCANARIGVGLRGRGERGGALLALLEASSPRRFSELRDLLGVSNGHMSQLVHRLLRYGLVERAGHGLYRLPAGDGRA